MGLLAQLYTLALATFAAPLTESSALGSIWQSIHMKLTTLFEGTVVIAATMAHAEARCPDYTTFSQVSMPRWARQGDSLLISSQTPQGNFSTGALALPYMRPAPACRTFNSSSVEVCASNLPLKLNSDSWIVQKVISDLNARLKDPDLARIFENTFPNTLGS